MLAPSAKHQKIKFHFYQEAFRILYEAQIPFLVTGAFAFTHYTGIRRNIKDLDIFLLKTDSRRALKEFTKAGYRTELKFSHWLGKIFHPNEKEFIDVIFSSGNGLCAVDQQFFENAVAGKVFQTPVQFSSPEEMIWQKAFVMERERYDGADVAHLLQAQSQMLDWNHLLRRFQDHWRVLLAHLILFGYIYPGDRTKIPDWVYRNLYDRLEQEIHESSIEEDLCRGTFLSRSQFRVDIEAWGYRDPRLAFTMTSKEAERWTADAGEDDEARVE
jgi:hypothetical protein